MTHTTVSDYTKVFTNGLNRVFRNCEPWQVATITATTVLSSVWLWNFINKDDSLWFRSKVAFFRQLRKIPSVRKQIDLEINKATINFRDELTKSFANLPYNLVLPLKGLSREQIVALVERYLNIGQYNWREGRVSGAVYAYHEELVQLITDVYGRASYTNPLHPDIFPGICKMEAEVIRMACTIFNGDNESCGTMTTGGTESILMACKAYRDYARSVKGITAPNMVAPRTAHAAFDKAAQYFNIHIKYVDVNASSMEVNVAAMKRAINRNTILLIGSAPNFPYGTVDDIESIAALGLRYNIPVHVDACLGSFLMAFIKEAGYKIKPIDFSVQGVTSISADTHKYGFAPKGCSVILYSDRKYRNHQYTVTTDWPGGVYGSPCVNGSRTGGIIAACWATMMSFGHDGYLEATKRIIDTARYIEQGVRQIDGIYVFGKPATSVIAMGSHVFDIFHLSEKLYNVGWNLNALQFPSGIHICITDMHTAPGVADKFLSDLSDAVAEIMMNPKQPVKGRMAIYGMAQSIPDRSVVGEVTKAYLDAMFYTPDCDSYTSGKERMPF